MKIFRIHRWEEMLSPWRKAVTICLFDRWCKTWYYGRGIYAEYIGGGYHRRMFLRKFLERKESKNANKVVSQLFLVKKRKVNSIFSLIATWNEILDDYFMIMK